MQMSKKIRQLRSSFINFFLKSSPLIKCLNYFCTKKKKNVHSLKIRNSNKKNESAPNSCGSDNYCVDTVEWMHNMDAN